MRLFIAAVIAAVSLQLSPTQRSRVAWVPNPRTANSSWVSDPSHHLRPATIAEINGIIGALERETTSEIGVAIVDSMSGLEAQEFATALHRVWGVGKAGKNNGVLLLWNPVHRDIFISVGYGLEGALPDRRAGRIRDDIIAEFRQNRFDEGILTGVREIAAAAREETSPAQGALRVAPDESRSAASPRRGGGVGGILKLIGGIVGGLGAVIGSLFGYRRWQRRKPRNCPSGHPMRLLDEKADDALLDQAAKLEEKLKSVDWDVWVCDTCGEKMILPYKAFLSSYTDCPKCKRRTATETTVTLLEATLTHGGRKRVTFFCQNCGHKTVQERDTPRLPPPSSSSGGSSGGGGSGGGGGGSFGGGSAGGGGAGGRY